MSESTATTMHDDAPAAPAFDPDVDLMADLEGSAAAVRAYQREGQTLRQGAAGE